MPTEIELLTEIECASDAVRLTQLMNMSDAPEERAKQRLQYSNAMERLQTAEAAYAAFKAAK